MTYIPYVEFDPHPFARGGSVAICSVSFMHIIQAILLFFLPAAGDATNMKAFLIFLKTVHVGLESTSVILIVTAILALFAALMRLGWIRLALFLPQHFILGIMTIGGLYAAYIGSYLDGTVMQWEHIFTDQLPLTILFIVHSSAIIRRARDPNG